MLPFLCAVTFPDSCSLSHLVVYFLFMYIFWVGGGGDFFCPLRLRLIILFSLGISEETG